MASALSGWRASPSARGLGEIVVACASTEFRILGPLQVLHDGGPIMLDSPKQRALLAVLLIRANQVVSTDSLLDALWGGDLPSAGLKTLRYHVSKLRAALREASDDAAAMVITQAPGYFLDVDPAQTDAGRFEAGVNSARRVLDLAPPEAAALLMDALSEWSGSALADFAFDDFAQAEIRRLEELRLTSVTDRVGAELASGAGGELAAELESLVVMHPRHEKLWAHLMLALHRSGRTSDAMEAYQRARAELSEAGMVPSDDLVTMESRILADDPALRPPASRPASGLPSPLTDLIGRETEVDAARTALVDRRLVTLVGPGGVGKTSVALETAHRLAEAEHTVAWVELASVTHPTRIAHRLATALGVGDQAGRDLLDSLRAHLQSRPTIMVVDNCEHLLEGAAELIADLVSSCPELRVLATSREALRVAGEKVFPIQPLPVPDDAALMDDGAVALFEARARDVDAGYVASAADRQTIAAICRTLDGLPLAIDLAAARMQVMGPEQLAVRLTDRFRALSSHTRGGPERHSSLESTMRWSYDQLNNNEQLLLDRLSVFADRFSLDAVERVCAFGEIHPDDIVDLLGELVAKSLVTRRPTSKLATFGLLETIREWAAASLNERDQGHKLADQHARYCTQAAAALPTTAKGLAGFRAVQAEIEKTVNHLFDTGSFEATAALMTASFSNWAHIGGARDAYRWFEHLVPNIGQLSPEARAYVLLGAER